MQSKVRRVARRADDPRRDGRPRRWARPAKYGRQVLAAWQLAEQALDGVSPEGELGFGQQTLNRSSHLVPQAFVNGPVAALANPV